MFWHGILIHFTRYQILSIYTTLSHSPISLYYFIFELFFLLSTLFQKYQKVLSLVFKHAARKKTLEISLLSPQFLSIYKYLLIKKKKTEQKPWGNYSTNEYKTSSCSLIDWEKIFTKYTISTCQQNKHKFFLCKSAVSC